MLFRFCHSNFDFSIQIFHFLHRFYGVVLSRNILLIKLSTLIYRFNLELIIFGLIRFDLYIKKQPNQKKIKNKTKSVQTDGFQFGLVFENKNPVQTGLVWFFLVLAWFFPVWLDFFFIFFYLVRFFRFQVYKTEPVGFLKF